MTITCRHEARFARYWPWIQFSLDNSSMDVRRSVDIDVDAFLLSLARVGNHEA